MKRLAQREPATFAVVLGLFALLLLFVALPLLRVLMASVVQDGGWTLETWRTMLTRHGALVPLWNSLRLAATVAVTGTVAGFAAAYTITMVAVPGRRAFRFVAMLPMLAPPFMIALAAIMLLGRNGVITRSVLEPLFGTGVEIYGFGGLVLVQTLTFFPLSMLLLLGTLAGMDPSLEEAAQAQGATPYRVFRDIVLPLAVPGLLSSMLLMFIESLADFGNPLILGGDFRVLSVAAFLRITGEFDTAGGAVLAILLLVPALTAFFVQRFYVQRTTFATVTGRPSALRRLHTGPGARTFAALSFVLLGSAVCLFYGAVLYGSFVQVWGVPGELTFGNYAGALRQAGGALTDSVVLAAIATPVTGIIGMGAAWVLTRRRFTGQGLLATLAMLTFAVPGTVVGIGYVLAFNSPPLQLTGTAAIIVLLFVFRSIPVSLEAGRNGIAQVDPAIEESSASLGATPLVTWRRVALPLAAPAVFAGLAHAFVRSITAVSAVIFVVSGQWNLVTVSILGFVENADLARAAALCVILVTIVSAVLAAMQFATSRMDARA
ncbi:MAG TPA: iron ABC transporter permease [Longimicrobiales bacterium]|nr:iron ABC transporter permease [Longimicrobiales bacterium]